MGFTHLELLPVMEHPFEGSWGYQCSGFFAPSARFGPPDGLRRLVDAAHRAGLGVILDWVPGHFPADAHGLRRFDGTALYEPLDPRRGLHKDWGSCLFDYERPEVVSFLVSSALFWIEEFHADGLRVDAVASMLYLDFCREAGEWLPNARGGRENLGAVAFLRRLNETLHREQPGVWICAEESTAWPGVTRPVERGGLGFDLKWNMGWMHDTLAYFRLDPVGRRLGAERLTFPMTYAFDERFLLPLSHDEVVYGKGSLLGKMPGRGRERFAALRTLLGLQFALPGRKLLFMGGEIAQEEEWDHDRAIAWELLERPEHRGVQRFVRALLALYRARRALQSEGAAWEGFAWVDLAEVERGFLAFSRTDPESGEALLIVANLGPGSRRRRLEVPEAPAYRVVLDSDEARFGGGGGAADREIAVEPAGRGRGEALLEVAIPGRTLLFLEPCPGGGPGGRSRKGRARLEG
jgi:1,4-alpha-glucan branching enzyme